LAKDIALTSTEELIVCPFCKGKGKWSVFSPSQSGVPAATKCEPCNGWGTVRKVTNLYARGAEADERG